MLWGEGFVRLIKLLLKKGNEFYKYIYIQLYVLTQDMQYKNIWITKL